MKKLTSLLLILIMALAPLSVLAEVTFPLELSHEWAQFDMGVTHSAAVDYNGLGYAWGYNYNAPIGNGVTSSSITYVPYNWGSGVTAVSTNNKTTLSIDENGVLYLCGQKWFGIGGDGTMPSDGSIYDHPTQIDTNVRYASMGFNHFVYVKNDNTLWVYGSNDYGQLGDGTTTAYYNLGTSAKQIMTGVAYAVAGEKLTAAVKTDGTLWVWGANDQGQVGSTSASNPQKTPIQVLTDVFTVSTMGKHVFAIKNDNTLWAWGYNNYGQLGNGNTTNQSKPVQVMTGVAQVSAGVYHTGVIKTDGTLWFCGRNYRGCFGNGNEGNYSSGVSSFTQTPGTYVAVNCGDDCSAAVAPTGQLFTAGVNVHGQTGVGANAGGTVASFTALDIWIFNDSEPVMHTVRFVDWDGELISEQGVLDGEAAEAPADPVRTGYTFTGWDRDFSCVTEDLTVWATYSVNSYQLVINYVYEDGSQAANTYIGTFEYGQLYSIESPEISGCTPDIAEVSGYMPEGGVNVTVTYTRNYTVLLGDVNCDGIVDFSDVSALNAYLMNAGSISEQGKLNANLNGDNAITAADVAALNKLLLGLS